MRSAMIIKTSKVVFVLIAAFAIVYAAIIAILLTGFGSTWWNKTEFDRDRWIDWVATEDTMTLRWDMITDLQTKHDFIGMKKAEIMRLLGKPDHVDMQNFGYHLGYSRRGVNTGHLYFEVDPEDIVVHMSV